MNRSPDGLRVHDYKEAYSSSHDHLLDDFYVPSLRNCDSYDRAAGYFSSSLLALAPLAFADFVERGGKMRLLCSPHLSPSDAHAFREAAHGNSWDTKEVLASSLKTLASSSDIESLMVRCLSSLIHHGALEVQFVVPTYGNGIFHDKVGIFRDFSGDGLSFVGSANETGSAWSGLANHEQFEVFPTWRSPESRGRFHRHGLDFAEMWEGIRRGLDVLPIENSDSIIRESCHPEPLDQIFAAIRNARPDNGNTRSKQRKLRDYQETALRNWALSNNKGIVSFATGGGKTLTAIKAIKDWTSSSRPALVLVPSKLLHSQWLAEIRSEISDNTSLLAAGAGHRKSTWIELLSTFSSSDEDFGPRIIVSTYQTASSPDFLSRIEGGDHLLVVGDEVHNAGAPQNRAFLNSLEAGGRLGLSATADRANDEGGTLALRNYFGQTLEPLFGIYEAIESRVLVPYDYFFELCQLSDDESELWESLSRKIGQDFVRNGNQISERGFILLQQRSRVAKSAESKALAAQRIICQNGQDTDRWLVYCADTNHLNDVRDQLKDIASPILEYHSQNEESHAEILKYFTRNGGILLAIKCLDEGIDIPAVNKAIILASSTNPREYIQRRGRVLRKFAGKYAAAIYDTVLVDAEGAALSVNELKRAREFASHSRNLVARAHLDDLMSRTVELRGTDRTDFDFESVDTDGED